MTTDTSRIFGLPAETIKKICAIFSHYDSVKKVILYGSRAKGNFKPASDIDLCIEDDSLSFGQLLKIENDLDDLLLPWKIDLSIKHKIDNPSLLEHIQEHGKIFYSR